MVEYKNIKNMKYISCIIINTGTTTYHFNYQNFFDLSWEYNIELPPNEITKIWYRPGTFSSLSDNSSISFVDCEDMTSNYTHNFQSCTDESNYFILTKIPSQLTIGDVYHIESSGELSGFSGCAKVSLTGGKDIYTAITLTKHNDCTECETTII